MRSLLLPDSRTMLLSYLCLLPLLSVFSPTASGTVSNGELRSFSEELLVLDAASGVGPTLSIDEGSRTTSTATDDPSPNQLFGPLPSSLDQKETFRILKDLGNNYFADVNRAEDNLAAEIDEKNAFLTAVMATPIMQKTEEFLTRKGLLHRSLRNVLDEIWFTPYNRARPVGSSAFEHVFMGEIKNRQVSGFHNWLSFAREEDEGDVNYQGWIRIIDLGHERQALKLRFSWLNRTKPLSSMFVGTTPEFEVALYTVCFFARPNGNCPIQLNNNRLSIKTFVQNYRGKTLIGTAFPQL